MKCTMEMEFACMEYSGLAVCVLIASCMCA